MLAMAVRIAQRIGLYNESANARCDPLEAELRRRLWWALVMFDSRLTELSSAKLVTLDPTWDCNILSNVSDSELRSEMKKAPIPRGPITEALFPVVRSELGDFIRQTSFHLEYTNPALKAIVPRLQENPDLEKNEVVELEKKIEEQYLKFCDEENPVHFMTLWFTRVYLAKWRLLEHHARHASSNLRPTDADRDIALSYAVRWLECDLKIMTSPLTKRFGWYNRFFFPAPAHIHIAQDLKKRPRNPQSWRCWELISEHYEVWYNFTFRGDNPITRIFHKLLLQAWKICEDTHADVAERLPMPGIISSIRKSSTEAGQSMQDHITTEMNFDFDSAFDAFSNTTTPLPAAFPEHDMAYDPQLPNDYITMQPHAYPSVPGPGFPGIHGNQMSWNGAGRWPGWGGL